MNGRHGILAVAACCLAAPAMAQTVVNESFENGQTNGWLANGNEMTFPGGNPGDYLGVPYLDFWGISLRNETPGSAVLGDIGRYPGLHIVVDVRVFALDNFFGEPMDPSNFPIVLELHNRSNPEQFVSVYAVGEGMPSVAAGWTEVEFAIPDPNQATLPAGWGGTGAENPVTFEPMLPAGVTYADVLNNVTEFSISTFQPGWFYSANWWQVGFDNLRIEVVGGGGGCPADRDGNGSIEPSDIALFVNDWLSSLSGGGLAGDFDHNGAVEPADIAAFVNAWLTALTGGC